MKITYIKILLLLLLMDNPDNELLNDSDNNILFNELKQDLYTLKNIALKLNKSEECIEYNINNILNQLINIYEIDINIITNIIKIPKEEIEQRIYKKTNNGKIWSRDDIEFLFDELKRRSGYEFKINFSNIFRNIVILNLYIIFLLILRNIILIEFK